MPAASRERMRQPASEAPERDAAVDRNRLRFGSPATRASLSTSQRMARNRATAGLACVGAAGRAAPSDADAPSYLPASIAFARCAISIDLGFASSGLGSVTVSTPSSYVALIELPSMPCGSVKERTNRPCHRSLR